MNSGKRNTARKVICLVLAVLILGSLVSGALIMTVGAASSKEIEKELIALREEQAELKKQSDALQSSIKDNQAKTQTLVEKKADIDQQMEMSRQSIENLNEQIQQYSLLIAQKQDELEQTEAEEARLNEQYKTRLRSMEETAKFPTGRPVWRQQLLRPSRQGQYDQRDRRVRQADARKDGRRCRADRD